MVSETVEAMAIERVRSLSLLAVLAVIATLASATVYQHYRHARAARAVGIASSTRSASPVAAVPPHGPTPEPYDSGAARLRAQALLKECLHQAESAAKLSWDGMCASLAQRNSEQRDHCREQGHTAADCQAAYAETPVTDCLLPHQTASSVAQAQQTAKSDCYQQFQAQMR